MTDEHVISIPEASVVENCDDDRNIPISAVMNDQNVEQGQIQVAIPTTITNVLVESIEKKHREYSIIKDLTFLNLFLSLLYFYFTSIAYLFVVICLQGTYATNFGEIYSLKIYKNCLIFQLCIRILIFMKILLFEYKKFKITISVITMLGTSCDVLIFYKIKVLLLKQTIENIDIGHTIDVQEYNISDNTYVVYDV